MSTILTKLHESNKCLTLDEKSWDKIHSVYPVLLSNHLLKEIKMENGNGLSRQFIPDVRELDDMDGAGAFFDDEKHITPMLVQKYPNRCILHTTSCCFSYCRHCSRKESWKNNKPFIRFEFDKALLKLKTMFNIEEVILTGGDVFTISPNDIDYMLNKLSEIDHIKVIRIGTRAFTSNPKIVSNELCNVLKKYNSIIVMTQFNHPNEFSKETIEAINKIQLCGIPILNQSVLLKDINDTVPIMKELLCKCATHKIIPYYLFHCFKVKGVQYLRTDVNKGEEIINNLVGNIGGWWIPRYTIIPHTTGIKIPLRPNGKIEENKKDIIVKDFKGRTIRYE